MKKLYIEDWKRQGYSYNTAFEGEIYHLVKDRNASGFRVEYNTRDIKEPAI